ncbi:hypothetical protein LTR28_006967 [Elasticomyces elasticus]|nr:hypothetical protein LTR28_006967 [Elasticomyces elasticus]
MSNKRTLHDFFSPPATKKIKVDTTTNLTTSTCDAASTHETYPFPVPQPPRELLDFLSFAPASEPRTMNDQLDLDLLYFPPYIPKEAEKDLFLFLRRELFFYRVQYKIKRGAIETQINTPRYTTVFGVDESSRFASDGSLVDAQTNRSIPKDRYACRPRPLPGCLDALRQLTESCTGETFNFCLVNYYASGNDSISYHSDDEHFLGPEPAIASISLGATRDFLMKHKPIPPSTIAPVADPKPLKLPLASGDMVLMRGRTQANWLHSIPKRKGAQSDKGRINITFRKTMVRGGTENYYRYNVGDGEVFKWNEGKRAMVPWAEVEGR